MKKRKNLKIKAKMETKTELSTFDWNQRFKIQRIGPHIFWIISKTNLKLKMSKIKSQKRRTDLSQEQEFDYQILFGEKIIIDIFDFFKLLK